MPLPTWDHTNCGTSLGKDCRKKKRLGDGTWSTKRKTDEPRIRQTRGGVGNDGILFTTNHPARTQRLVPISTRKPAFGLILIDLREKLTNETVNAQIIGRIG